MENEINYKEGDNITPNCEFPVIPGIVFPEKGKVYTCESLFYVGNILTVYLKEITSGVPNIVNHNGATYKIKDGYNNRACYTANRFDKVQPQYTDITKELADSVGITEEVPDVKKIKELETSN